DVRSNRPLMIPAYPPLNRVAIPLRFQEFPRLQRTNAGVEGFRSGNVKEGCKVIDGLPVWTCVDIRHLQQGGNLAAEGEAVTLRCIEQRLDAEPISGKK